MPFMLILLVALLAAVVWGFFHSNPAGVPRLRVHACNGGIVALALAAGLAAGAVLHVDAVARRPEEPVLAAYLAVMAGGTAFMILLAVGGLARNLFVFPLSRRGQP